MGNKIDERMISLQKFEKEHLKENYCINKILDAIIRMNNPIFIDDSINSLKIFLEYNTYCLIRRKDIADVYDNIKKRKRSLKAFRRYSDLITMEYALTRTEMFLVEITLRLQIKPPS